MKSNRFWVILFAIILLVSGAAVWLMGQGDSPASAAVISLNSVTIETIDLSRVEEPYTFTVEADGGRRITLEVIPGDIRIIHADCPDGLCIEREWLSGGATPIVCLPNRLVIEATGSVSGFDAVVS